MDMQVKYLDNGKVHTVTTDYSVYTIELLAAEDNPSNDWKGAWDVTYTRYAEGIKHTATMQRHKDKGEASKAAAAWLYSVS